MADVETTVLGLVKQTIGANRNTWGGIINACWDLVEGAIYGKTSKVVTGGSVTLTSAERRKRVLEFTGTLASNQTVVVDNLVGQWRVKNGTAGNFTLSFKTSSGTAVEVPQGEICTVTCDGNNVIYVGASNQVQSLAPDGTIAAPGRAYKTEKTAGFRRVSSGVMAWVIGGVDLLTLSVTSFVAALNSGGSYVFKIAGTTVATLSAAGLALTVPLTVNGASPVPVGATLPWDGIDPPAGWLFKFGQALSRTTYALLFAAMSKTVGATRTNGSPTLTGVDTDLTDLGVVGLAVEGTGVPSGTVIDSVTATSITMSQNATGNGAITLRIYAAGYAGGDGSTTFTIADDRDMTDVGRGDMGGDARGLHTGIDDGLDTSKLGKIGGIEGVQLTEAQLASHDHDVFLHDPGHFHVVERVHSSAPGSFQATTPNANTNGVNTLSSTTGITIRNQAGGGGTENTTATAGSGEVHSNVQPSRVVNKIVFTGVFA